MAGKNLEQLVDTVIDAGVHGGDDAVEAALTVEFPILGAPIVSFLLDELVSGIGAGIAKSLVTIANRIVIDIQVNGEESDVFKAAVAFQVAQATNDPAALSEATYRLVDSYRKLGATDNAS